MAASNLLTRSSGSFLVSRFHPSIPFNPRNPNRVQLPLVKVTKPRFGIHQFAPAIIRKCATARWNGHQEFPTSQDEFDDDPLWLAVLKDLVWGLRSLAAFLAEQPSQVKYLEWPGFQNTLKTATLTLILVALFIVVLSSVDCALCYMLAWLLRKSA